MRGALASHGDVSVLLALLQFTCCVALCGVPDAFLSLVARRVLSTGRRCACWGTRCLRGPCRWARPGCLATNCFPWAQLAVTGARLRLLCSCGCGAGAVRFCRLAVGECARAALGFVLVRARGRVCGGLSVLVAVGRALLEVWCGRTGQGSVSRWWQMEWASGERWVGVEREAQSHGRRV